MKKLVLIFLNIYQKFFTLIGYGSCRYYPTCSEYAKWQFEKNSFFKATLFTIKRILTCNQLFSGGIDYPIVKKNLNCNRVCTHKQDKKLFFVKFYLIPTTGDKNNQHYYLVKSFKKENID
jgi:putative membrane protein insertion efficiency factor